MSKKSTKKTAKSAKKKVVKSVKKKVVKSAKKKVVKSAKKKSAKKSSLANRLMEEKKNLERMRSKSIKKGEGLFRECVNQLFKDHPDLQSFSWSQYTPHWNDGDECVFGTYFDSMRINGEEDPECLYTLEHCNSLLADRTRAESRIVLELTDTKKDRWEIDSLKRDLETIKTRDPKEVADKYRLKKAVHDFITNIDDSVYEEMFGEGTVVVSRDGINVEPCEHD